MKFPKRFAPLLFGLIHAWLSSYLLAWAVAFQRFAACSDYAPTGSQPEH